MTRGSIVGLCYGALMFVAVFAVLDVEDNRDALVLDARGQSRFLEPSAFPFVLTLLSPAIHDVDGVQLSEDAVHGDARTVTVFPTAAVAYRGAGPDDVEIVGAYWDAIRADGGGVIARFSNDDVLLVDEQQNDWRRVFVLYDAGVLSFFCRHCTSIEPRCSLPWPPSVEPAQVFGVDTSDPMRMDVAYFNR